MKTSMRSMIFKTLKKDSFLKFVSKLKKSKSLYEFIELLKYPNIVK